MGHLVRQCVFGEHTPVARLAPEWGQSCGYARHRHWPNGVAWVVARSTYSVLWLNSLTSAGFGTWVSLGGVVASDPAIAIPSGGIAHIVARDGSGGTGQVWLHRALNGVSLGWTNTGGVIRGNPAIVAGLDGTAHIIVREPYNSPWIGVISGTTVTWRGTGGSLETDPVGIHVNNVVTAVAVRSGQAWAGAFSVGSLTWGAWSSLGQAATSCGAANLQANLVVACRDSAGQLLWYSPATGWVNYGSAFAGGPLTTSPTGSTALIGLPVTTITSSTPGLSLTVDGANCTAPCTFQWNVGSTHTVAANTSQSLTGTTYYFSYWSDSGAQTHTITAPSTAATYSAMYATDAVQAVRNCISGSSAAICTLAERPAPYTISSTIEIDRSNVVLRGGTTGMNDTKLARDPTFTGELIRIGQNASVSGVGIKYLTVCGGSSITPNWGPAPPSPVGCPRVQTVCGDRTRYATEHPGETGLPGQCSDIKVVRSGLPVFPPDPFNSPPGSYAVEFNHIDLEDATGHALSLRGYNGIHVSDIYFHDGAINYSGVTGILMGVDGVGYGRKFCDGYTDPVYGFANDPSVFAPRNIRVEYNQFTENRTGVTGDIGRWVAYRHNTFTRNYIWPQAQGGSIPGTNPPVGDPNESWGGTLEFDACSDQVEVKNNAFVGPGSAHQKTQSLEMYGRNIVVDSNSVSGYSLQGIVANSVKQASIRNNTISFTAPANPGEGGITVTTVGAGGACTTDPLNIYRESRDISISGNTISGQNYGVNLAEHPYRSSGAIHNLTIGTNYGNWTAAQYWQNAFVWANAYNGYSGPPTTLGPRLPGLGVTPRVLPVDAESGSMRALCSLPGGASGSFTFAAADDSNGSANLLGLNPRLDYGAPGYAGAAQILSLEGVFSDTGPPYGPSNTTQDCHFYVAVEADPSVVYLDDGTGTWCNGACSSAVGPGGHDLTNGGCTIHSASSSASVVQPGQYARSVTLHVDFLSPGKKHLYVYARNKNGIVSYAHYDEVSPVIWQYWGWWQKPSGGL